MQIPLYILTILATSSQLAHCAPRGVHVASGVAAGVAISSLANSEEANEGSSSSGSDSDSSGDSTPVYSADTSDGSVVPFAQDPGWASSMTSCLGQLNNAAWNGAECVPVAANGNALGPKFGFYKGGKNMDNGFDCFNACQPCLAEGIANQRAVTTSCTWKAGDKASCSMGFKYGG